MEVGLGRYTALRQIPGAPALLGFGLLARLGLSMTPLGLLLLIQQATGRYAPATLAVAVYTLALAAVSPVAGRIADRAGPSLVLLATAAIHPVGLAALILLSRGTLRLAGMVVAAAVSGATYPPLVALLRGAWIGLTEPAGDWAHLRAPALAADTALFQSVFVVGPLLVAGLVVIGSPSVVIAGSAVVTAVGTLALARGHAIRAWRPGPRAVSGSGFGPLRVTGIPAMMVCAAGLGAVFGVVTVAVPAYATAHGSEALGGVLLAVLSAGSVAGGVWYGASRPRAPLARQFALLLAGVAASYAGFALLAGLAGPAVLAVALFLGGAMVAPALTVESALVGRIVPVGTRNEAYTWVISIEVAASSAGYQVSGLIVDRPGGLPWAFLTAGVAVGLAAAVAAWPGGSIARAARALSDPVTG